MKIKSTDPYVDLRHLQKIADDVDALSATVVGTAIEEIKKTRLQVKQLEWFIKMHVSDNEQRQYWAGQNKKTGDVFTNTLCKSKEDTLLQMEHIFGDDWYLDDDFDVILVEIKEVSVK